ncbi:hypothetical protein Catovirus_1_626 [Catovirus CTV1]|uniref:Uncharacterized protein n=1 Tax=Catovirus CTV1 TaxID=1977631 RepID=A0A1V0SA38_9VIRU|nr:hypothetical protein Catovirus_1_626 [Catovirus CTV1]
MILRYPIILSLLHQRNWWGDISSLMTIHHRFVTPIECLINTIMTTKSKEESTSFLFGGRKFEFKQIDSDVMRLYNNDECDCSYSCWA